MDIIARGVLEYIQKDQPEAIIAGGACRDGVLGLVPKDYDIWVPANTVLNMPKLVEEFGIKDFRQKGKEYETAFHDNRIKAVWSFRVEDKEFDLITWKKDKGSEDDFPKQVINSFDYAINMVYYDGTGIDESHEEFNRDIRYQQISLINLASIGHLPNAMLRYYKMRDKIVEGLGEEFAFRAPCLSHISPKGMKEKSNSYAKAKYALDDIDEREINPIPVRRVNPAQPRWEDRGVNPFLEQEVREGRVGMQWQAEFNNAVEQAEAQVQVVQQAIQNQNLFGIGQIDNRAAQDRWAAVPEVDF